MRSAPTNVRRCGAGVGQLDMDRHFGSRAAGCRCCFIRPTICVAEGPVAAGVEFFPTGPWASRQENRYDLGI